ncbi:bifunctional hydroxymethylpyrimidine kinase/phosphomethylpyrimidine kinase [Clostridium ihumii]|uniref:bifunctional hydroxymethylpyrimidine kinase/phosphomethylpyrimidine kinase n=1 Tax=Clostridium ihumii TaxID=1470356 RepID=UPI00058F5F96|nr:bifunctional hydroxymethylpyrimidine kinase/phosphomethylpyrimidine kinase [Clostridium ihumii]
MKKVLTIAGSDSSGGAGIQADLKAFSANKTFGMSVITAITAQNTMGVTDIFDIPESTVESQIRAIFEDIEVSATKIGMVSNERIIIKIASELKKYNAENIVVDPVMVSTTGYDLLKPEAKKALIENLLPIAKVLTPNLRETEVLCDMKIDTIEDMKEAGKKILQMGPEYVLVKGGHLEGNCIDVLVSKDNIVELVGERINSKNTHGTGCTLSSAIASNLANGYDVLESVRLAKEYITGAIKNSFDVGHGSGPVNHFYKFY